MSELWNLLAFIGLSFGLPIVWGRLGQKQPNTESGLYPFTGIVRFLYFVGLPYIAILLGLITLEQLGLPGLSSFYFIDWNGNLLLGVQQATTLMLLSWLLDSGIAILAGGTALLLLLIVRWGGMRQGIKLRMLNQSLVEVIYYALHWAFYRAIFWSITDDLYLGVVLGIGAVLIEWLLVAQTRNQTLLPQATLVNGMILVLTASAFFYSPNLWLLLPFHWGMVAVVSRQMSLGRTAASP